MLAKLHKNQAAIADYTAVLDIPGVTAGLRAMVLYNRALVHHANAHESKAIDDLNRVLEMADAGGRVKMEARRKLVRMERTTIWRDSRESIANAGSQGGTDARTEPKRIGKHTD